MNKLLINDIEAKRMIKMIKNIFENHDIDLSSSSHGKINIEGSGDAKFILNYRSTVTKTVLNFRELKHNYTLLRINLNENFHKNADGTKVFGPRINVFSENEYYAKGDGNTHCIAYPLPYKTIPNEDDFYEILVALLKYTNTHGINKVTFQAHLSLD